jgi:hypothetical protein
MKFPDPVIGIAIEPKTQADQDKLGVGLSKLAEEMGSTAPQGELQRTVNSIFYNAYHKMNILILLNRIEG